MDSFHIATAAAMRLPGETFEQYAARVWPTRAETGRPDEERARYVYSLAPINPYAETE